VLGDARVFVDSANAFPTNAFSTSRVDAGRAAITGIAGLQSGQSLRDFRAGIANACQRKLLFSGVMNFFEFGIREPELIDQE
jgi:hypothetical protein